MPPKRKVTSKSKPPKVQLDPEAEKELQKEIDFCICHFEELKNATKSEDQYKKCEKVLKTLESYTTPIIKKKALIRQELPKYKELMVEFEKEWDKETNKTGNFTASKPNTKSVALKRRSNDTLSEKMAGVSLKDDFKWKPTNETFSFNFDISEVRVRSETSRTMACRPNGVGRKKLVIKNFTGPRKLPKNYEEETWQMLEEAVKAIQNRSSFIRYSLEKLNQTVANLVDGNAETARKIHQQLKDRFILLCSSIEASVEEKSDVCEEHIKTKLAELEVKSTSVDTRSKLTMLDTIWRDHCKAFILIINLFLKLDRSSQCGGLWDLGIEIFGRIVREKSIEEQTIEGVLLLIQNERQGDMMDRCLVRSLVSMLSAIDVYETFEKRLLDESEKYFEKISIEKLDSIDVKDYLELAERTIKEEETRAQTYLEPSTLRPLVKVCHNKFIGKNKKVVAARGLSDMMQNDRLNDLSRLYKLFGIDPEGYNTLKFELGQWIKHQGSAIVVNSEKDSTMVVELLEFKHKIDRVMKVCFESNREILDAVHDSFKHFINIRKNRPAELIAKYVDHLMKSGNKVVDDTQLEKKLDDVMALFRFIHGKDVFEKFYKNDLAKRLLHSRSASDDAEKAMLSKLREECGSSFTQKLEGMFKDIEVSKELMRNYKNKTVSSHNSDKKEIELTVYVLTTSNWSIPNITLTLPAELIRLSDAFKNYYASKHNSRKLTFSHYHSNAIVTANYRKEPKEGEEIGKPRAHELQVSLSQCCILLLFNERDDLSYTDIANELKLPPHELKRQLQTLSLGKQKLLLKSTKGKEVKEGVSFKWNDKFKHHLYRIKINTVQIKETVEENRETNEQIFQDRQLQVDAAIVRIMKAKKELTHGELMATLFEHLNFPMSPPDLKKRIEHLIDRDFIERDPECANRYRYLA